MAQGDDVGEGAPSVEAPPDVVDGTVSDSGDCGHGYGNTHCILHGVTQ